MGEAAQPMKEETMRRRSAPFAATGLALVAVLAAAAPACGRKKAERAHGSEEAAAPAVPTPDNTPINVLRTPAGLVLKTDEPTPREATPAPPASTTPASKTTP